MSTAVISGIGELVTNDPNRDGLLGVVRNACVAIEDGRVVWAGVESSAPAEYRRAPGLDVNGRAVLPGFVDAHTHLVFAGHRADEFAARLKGHTYGETVAAGGGIRTTVAATRAASDERLIDESTDRVTHMLQSGTTTIEIKSGYGLDVETERRQLEIAAALDQALPVDVVPTFLGAHDVPDEYSDDRSAYVDLVVEEMLPACAPLARYCDVSCDEGAFTVDEARRVLEAARGHGLGLRLHANEIGASGGAALAGEVGATSADHLVHVGADDVAAIADAGTVGVLLPASSFSLRGSYAPGPDLWDAGVVVALATDCNPGSSYVESMPFVIALACTEMGLTPAQAVWAATRGGAFAVEAPDKGWVGEGAIADLVVLDAPSHLHIPYRPGSNLVAAVMKDGEIVSSAR